MVSDDTSKPLKSPSQKWLAPSVMAMCIIAAVGWYRYGSAVLSSFGRKPLVFRDLTEVGTVERGPAYTVRVSLANTSGTSIIVLGAETSCGCMNLTGLPFTLPPGEARTLEIRFDTRGKDGHILGVVRLFTDCPEQPSPSFRISATVVAPNPARESNKPSRRGP
jgi:Protein of unknown function (DUF1573)